MVDCKRTLGAAASKGLINGRTLRPVDTRQSQIRVSGVEVVYNIGPNQLEHNLGDTSRAGGANKCL